MTRKLFWDDPYRRKASTAVTSVDGATITIAETIFYAESGGQESDAGNIGGREALRAYKDRTEIRYTLPPDHGLTDGDSVDVEIDWARRYRLMRLHFAAETVLELIYRDFGPVEKISAHIAAEKARIDFAWADSIAPVLPTVSECAQAKSAPFG